MADKAKGADNWFGTDPDAPKSKHNADQDKHAVSAEEAKKGAFKRPATQFHDKISADGSTDYKAESGRYHLYVAWACPWAHRTLMTRALKGLEDAISVTMLGWRLEWPTDGRPYRGWPFTKEDPDPFHPEWEYLHDLYRSVDPDYPHKSITVPVLFDKKTKKIVNNESAEIIAMLNSEFNAFAKNPDLNLAPAALEDKMKEIDDIVYPKINDGVYRCGFANSQEAYDTAFEKLFEGMEEVEKVLSKNRYLTGDKLTLSDVRLATTLFRFDMVYHTHFKCNKKRLVDYPNMWAYARDIFQMKGVADTFNPLETRKHYYGSHLQINPKGIVAHGPELDFNEPHGRDKM